MTTLRIPEPVGYFEWFDGKPLWGEACVCNDPVYPADSDSESMSMPIYTAESLRDVLEQAAQIAARHSTCKNDNANVIEMAIRALKEQL